MYPSPVNTSLCSCKIASLVNPFTSETELTSNSLLIDRSSNSSHVFPDNSELGASSITKNFALVIFHQSGCQGRLHLWEHTFSIVRFQNSTSSLQVWSGLNLYKIFHSQTICLWSAINLAPLLISDGLYQQLNYSLHLVISSAFIGWESRTFLNITTDSIYILIQEWLSMTQLLLVHSWRSHYKINESEGNSHTKFSEFPWLHNVSFTCKAYYIVHV